MSQKTDQELYTDAQVIQNASQDGENTASRIAQMYIDIIDSKYNRDENIRPYKVFTANLTQSGKNDNSDIQQGGSLIKGRTYCISANGGVDFVPFGAVDNNVGTCFISTSNDEPDWNSGATLEYRNGLPVCNVFENTLDDVWFDMSNTGEGQYLIRSSNFVDSNMWVNVSHTILNNFGFTSYVIDGAYLYILTYNDTWTSDDSLLNNTSIEIRVYN